MSDNNFVIHWLPFRHECGHNVDYGVEVPQLMSVEAVQALIGQMIGAILYYPCPWCGGEKKRKVLPEGVHIFRTHIGDWPMELYGQRAGSGVDDYAIRNAEYAKTHSLAAMSNWKFNAN